MAEPPLIDGHGPPAIGIERSRLWQLRHAPQRRPVGMLQHTAEPSNEIDSVERQLAFVVARLGKVTKRAPRATRWMSNHRPRPVIKACVTPHVPHVEQQIEVDRIGPAKQSADLPHVSPQR